MDACERRRRYDAIKLRKVLVGILALLLVAGCGGRSVVGKWSYSIFGQEFMLDLKDDNTFAMGSASTSVNAGTYTYDDGKVTLSQGEGGQTMTFTLSGDGNKLSGSVGPMNVEFTRKNQ